MATRVAARWPAAPSALMITALRRATHSAAAQAHARTFSGLALRGGGGGSIAARTLRGWAEFGGSARRAVLGGGRSWQRQLSTGRGPRGFENFNRKGKSAPGKKDSAPAEGKPEAKAESGQGKGGDKGAGTASAGKKKPASGDSGSGGGSKKADGGGKKADGGSESGVGGLGGSMGNMGGMFPEGKNARQLAMLIAGAGGLSFLFLSGSENPQGRTKEITFVDFCSQLVETGQVEKVVISNQAHAYVYMRSADRPDEPGEARYHFTIGSVDAFERRLEEVQRQLKIDTFEFIPVSYRSEISVLGEAARFLPVLLMIGFFAYMRRSMGGLPGMGGGGGGRNPMSVGKSNATVFNKDKKIGVKFQDVAGLLEAKVEVQEFVHFLKDPKKYEAIGAKIPKGGILHGPPGTGKTLLAKAVAGESGVPFYSISGADFMEMFVGVGPSRVRDLFKSAREDAPCIVFIDEIDAIGRKRGKGGMMGGNDERENTLNQLLVEMDGFKESSGVVVLAGTNRLDVLDSALLRPGRFDRQIIIDNPDIKGRCEIFKVHMKPLILDDEIEEYAKKIAVLTPGMSGADIKNICNEAALHAARRDGESISMEDFDAAMGRVIGGIERKSRVLNEKEKRTVAWHEAGASFCPTARARAFAPCCRRCCGDKSWRVRRACDCWLVLRARSASAQGLHRAARLGGTRIRTVPPARPVSATHSQPSECRRPKTFTRSLVAAGTFTRRRSSWIRW